MQIHGPSFVHGAQPLSGPHRAAATPQSAPPASYSPAADELTLSPEATLASQLRAIPDIRADRVAELKAQIASGAYETDAKLNVALDRMLDEMA